MSRVDTSPTTDKLIRIRQARLYNEEKSRDIIVRNGVVVGTDVLCDTADTELVEIDAANCLVVPGLVDLYSRCREPGITRKGNIASESIAALSAGFTQVMCSPDTLPVVDSVATVELIMHRSNIVHGGASIVPMAALTAGLQGAQLSELATLQAAGCPVASQADVPIENTTVLYSAMEYASSFNMPLVLTARDAQLGIDGCAHAGAIATQLGLPAIPVAAETVALSRLIELCRETGCHVHVSRISTARAVQKIRDAKEAGLPVSCDVGIHHLFYIDELLAGYDASFHCAVPFRSRADRQALRDGLKDGVVDAICSDHAPHDIDAGLAPFPATEPGLSAYDWFIPLLLQLPEVTGLSLQQLIGKLRDAPLEVLGADATDPIAVGSNASFFLLDTDADFINDADTILSAGANNPLATHSAESLGLGLLKGKVHTAFHAGWATRYD